MVRVLLILGLLSLNVIILQAFDVLAENRVVPKSHQQITYSFAPLVKQTAPAVVNIYTKKKVKVRNNAGISPFFNDPFFSRFFDKGLFGRGLGRMHEKEVSSLGSGVLLSKDGLVITNHHVIKEGIGGTIKVVLSDKREYEAKLVLGDAKTDLALIKIEVEEPLPFLELSKADALEVGDLVLAVGNPFGVGQTVTSGIVSALARTTVGIGDYDFFIQTDAAINPGNSGGALVDMHGKLVGINTAIYSKTGGSNGIGFATPAIMAKTVLDSYNRGSNKIVRPWFGATSQNVTSAIAESMDLDKPGGVLIREIYPNSSAHKAGLQIGDVILAIDDTQVLDSDSLKFHIATYNIGDEATLTMVRDGEYYEATVVMEVAQEWPMRNTSVIKSDSPFSGATVENLSPALAEEIGLSYTKGVIVRGVAQRSYAARLVRSGDIIMKINGVTIKTIAHLQKELSASVRGWKIVIRRGAKIMTVTINR